MRRAIPLLLLLVACGGGRDSGAPAGSAPDAEVEATPVSEDRSIEAVLERHAHRLMDREGIQGIYIGRDDDGSPCLVVIATVPADSLADVVPDSLEGWPVYIDASDEIRPMD